MLDNPTYYAADFGTMITRYMDGEVKGMLPTADFTLLHQYWLASITSSPRNDNNELETTWATAHHDE